MTWEQAINLTVVVTILVGLGFGWRLYQRLTRFSQTAREAAVAIDKFFAATEDVQRTVLGLSETARRQQQDMNSQLELARQLRDELAFLQERAGQMADQLAVMIEKSRPLAAQSKVTAPKEVPAAHETDQNQPLSKAAQALQAALRDR